MPRPKIIPADEKKPRDLAAEYKALQMDNQRVEPLMLRANMLLAASGKRPSYIQTKCGVTTQTLRNWAKHRTRRPNSSTLRFVGEALGYDLDFIKRRKS
jgi:hypothetical protein